MQLKNRRRRARGCRKRLADLPLLHQAASCQVQDYPGGGRRGLEFHISGLKMFEFAVSDQKNHRDSLNFRGPGRSGRQKLFYAYISLHQACLVNQLKFSHLYF